MLPRSAPKPPVSRPVDRTQPAAGLEREIAELWRTFPGTTGIAIRQIDSGWMIGQRGDQLFPQQSVSKLWVAMTILEKIDLGRAALTDPVRITSDDLTLFYQPLADSVARNGSVTLTVAELLEKALATSDNTANDSLLRAAGGPAAVNDFIQRKGLGKIRFGPGERLLQSRIAGLEWRQDLSQGRKFYTARANLPLETRQQALSRYLADPIDGASPFAIVTAFDRLARGEILSPASTRLLQDILSRTKSGPNRLKAGVPPGWQFLHKTGTGQDLAGVSTGYNDVGMMTAPDGTRYAIAVMLGDTTAPVPARMQLMQNVARAVANYHQR
ncbi:MAG: class A beta-lactamase [Parasphingorhabdus sp.]|nr:class A beta-lactamase [Parasphingorhabdus sp.]